VSQVCPISLSGEMVVVGLEIWNSFPWVCVEFELLVEMLQVVLGIANVWGAEI